jgi:uncharacterized protein (TIGR02284 family)
MGGSSAGTEVAPAAEEEVRNMVRTLTAETQKTIDQLNSLLRGEISAAETYAQAIRKVGDEHASEAAELKDIAAEHGENAQRLRGAIRGLGGDPEDSSGAWGTWAQTVEGVAMLFGDASALKALKEGEEHGLKDYREALEDVDPESRALISGVLIPAQLRHIATLDSMLELFD